MIKYLERFKNPGTLVSVVSLIALIAIQFGAVINLEWLDTTVKLVCSLGVVIGVMNNPTTPGIDLPINTPVENEPSNDNI